ncbi:MAG: hypothetical protein AAF542_08635 [Pseudomonadota bacterium]
MKRRQLLAEACGTSAGSLLSQLLPTVLLALIALAGFPIASATVVEDLEPYVTGKAFEPGGSTLLYIEEHYKVAESLHKVVYLDPNRELVAEKLIDYSANIYAPNVQVDDYRAKRATLIEHGAEVCEVSISDLESNAEKRVFTFQPERHDVMDAGFDNYVRKHWDQLAQGETVKFRFMLPLRDSTIGLKLKPRQCEGNTIDTGVSELCFRISPSNWLVSALAAPIDLVYERDTQRLLRFIGQGQLPDARGKSMEVDLRYEYQ